MKAKKPRGFKSKKLSQDDLSVEFIKDPTEIIQITAWGAKVTLTPTEVVRLYDWLKKATPYIKKLYPGEL